MWREMSSANVETDKKTGLVKLVTSATLLETLWKGVELDWMKTIGGGIQKEINANVETEKVDGDVIIVIS